MSEELKPPQFPIMLRKMWSGSEVQAWINDNWNRRAQPEPAAPVSPTWSREEIEGAAYSLGMRYVAQSAEPADALAGMSEMNRTIAYSAASKLREIGYEWTGKEWAAPSVAPEPVAWRYQDARGHYRYRAYKPGFDVEYAILKPVPLYEAHPPRAPLTDAEIETGREAIFSTSNPYCPCDSKTMRKAVRWTEAKHGICAAAIGAAK